MAGHFLQKYVSHYTEQIKYRSYMQKTYINFFKMNIFTSYSMNWYVILAI